MNAVDVLAVMVRAIENLEDAGVIGNTIRMREARAAVAELIEATKHLRDCGGDEGSDPGSTADMRLDAAKDRVDAALARVGGGK